MHFKRHHINCNETDIHLMSYSEFDPSTYLDKLTANELDRYHSFSNIKRKREFVATRLLRHETLGFQHIHYTPLGAPFIEGEGFISISHSKNLVGLAINKDHTVGLDLEFPREKILNIKTKFLSETEMEVFDMTDYKIITQLWSAKEAMYKLAGRKKILFSQELHLLPLGKKALKGVIINSDHRLNVKLDIFEYNDIIITINSEAIERID